MGTLFYESLSCKPRFSDSGKCPDYFECDKPNEITNNCFFNGKQYKIGELIEENTQISYCKANCMCKKEGYV